MKVIFLDVDGVLVTWRSHFAFSSQPIDGSGRFSSGLMKNPDPVTIAFLDKFCTVYYSKIVMSSTWRSSPKNCHTALGILNQHLHDDWRTIQSGDKRGVQIQEWLSRHPEVGTYEYFIIDDDSDMLESQMHAFIKCDGWDGLSGLAMERMINLTRGGIPLPDPLKLAKEDAALREILIQENEK